MTTNPIQSIKLFYGELLIRMKDREVRLNNIIDAANNLRKNRGLPPIAMINYTRSSGFIEAVMAAEMKLGLRAQDDYSGRVPNIKHNGEIGNYKNIVSPLVRTAKGRGRPSCTVGFNTLPSMRVVC